MFTELKFKDPNIAFVSLSPSNGQMYLTGIKGYVSKGL